MTPTPPPHRPILSAFSIAAMLVAGGIMSGCYESADDVALHQPGAYLGKRDSDAVLHPGDEARAALKERFRQIQTDR